MIMQVTCTLANRFSVTNVPVTFLHLFQALSRFSGISFSNFSIRVFSLLSSECLVCDNFCCIAGSFFWSSVTFLLARLNIRAKFSTSCVQGEERRFLKLFRERLKKQWWKIPYRVLNPSVMEKKKFNFFLKLDHFLKTFVTIENPKKKIENFSKNDKTTFRQANFCLLRCQILLRHAQ